MSSLQSSHTRLVFKLGSVLGYGSYGMVYNATKEGENVSDSVAVKKSRVSLHRKRTMLQHESRVLQLLQGHRAIPAVYAYGRFEHFEYLAMERLGPSVMDLMQHSSGAPLKTVLLIANQMLSALEHIHSHGIIHRDIKPENILFSVQDSNGVRLIDFGIARRYKTGIPSQYDPVVERKSIVGTLTWASLNAHHGIDLSRRDDLESLAYTLFFLLRGDLPWRKALRNQGTAIADMLQAREQKKTWTGVKLAEGYPSEFAEFLDYARSLSFEDKPDYSRFTRMFTDLYHRSKFEDDGMLVWSPPSPVFADRNLTSFQSTDTQGPALTAGQLIYVEVLAGLTLQGIPKLNDSNVWYDPSFLRDEWQFPPRPAVVIESHFNADEGRRYVKVAPLACGQPPSTMPSVRIARDVDQLEPSESVRICTHPAWRIPGTYCYAFAKLNTFVAVDNQPVPAVYQVDPDMVKLLEDTFTAADQIKMPNEEDARTYESIRKRGTFPVFARITPLRPDSIEKAPEEWSGTRGWFDELAKIGRRRALENGWPWTETPEALVNRKDGGSVEESSDSYCGFDLADWESQGERDVSLTLSSGETEMLDAQIQCIDEIVKI